MGLAKNGRGPGPDVPIIFTPQCENPWGGNGEHWARKVSGICQRKYVRCKESGGSLRQPG